MKKAKKCPVCKSRDLKWVYYAPTAEQAPNIWEDMVDVGYQPMILAKRIECRDCGATVPGLTLTLDDAIDYWNEINGDPRRLGMGKRLVGRRKRRASARFPADQHDPRLRGTGKME